MTKYLSLIFTIWIMVASSFQVQSSTQDYLKDAEQGDAKAQFVLGWMYDFGEGAEQDAHKAVYWYRKSAEGGNVNAKYNLGVMYKYGRGVSQDNQVAKEWFKKSCDGGDQDGCKAYRAFQ